MRGTLAKCDALADLNALNSSAIFNDPIPATIFPPQTNADMHGIEHPLLVSEEVRELRTEFKRFVATWARIAKGRFSFARECEDTPVNRAALHRFFAGKWREAEMDHLQFDRFMDACIDMALEPTAERMIHLGKRAQRRLARAEYYGERCFNQRER